MDSFFHPVPHPVLQSWNGRYAFLLRGSGGVSCLVAELAFPYRDSHIPWKTSIKGRKSLTRYHNQWNAAFMSVKSDFAVLVHEISKSDEAFFVTANPVSSVMELVAVTTCAAVLGAINTIIIVTERQQWKGSQIEFGEAVKEGMKRAVLKSAEQDNSERNMSTGNKFFPGIVPWRAFLWNHTVGVVCSRADGVRIKHSCQKVLSRFVFLLVVFFIIPYLLTLTLHWDT